MIEAIRKTSVDKIRQAGNVVTLLVSGQNIEFFTSNPGAASHLYAALRGEVALRDGWLESADIAKLIVQSEEKSQKGTPGQ